ncbi:helix-hairpin-helix domain-containing protein [Haloplanus natans]|uniref:helix-hairpin-helix domain-containing protein n=1 Tax=Haloplanus natans TaxID=376171 RepID=UPI000677ED00|nr:helix-hairpin-helix domain-containing protein [Haloplanus natans]
MGILDTLLSLLGLGNSSSDDDRRETTVSVEREANTDTEAAVKGTDDGGSPSAAGTDAVASTESLVDEREEPAEPAEAVEAGDAETELDTADAESEGETTGEHDPVDIEDAEESAATGTDAESVEVIKGIGPAYAERLSNAGVDSVADLAAADVSELAAAVDLSETRVGRWIERARER